MNKDLIAQWFQSLQDDICKSLEYEDQSGTFMEDKWERNGGGGGRSRVIKNGKVIEKGGVNFSAVHGKLPQKIIDALGMNEDVFFATGVSIVIHPISPMVPIIHMNVRYFEMGNGQSWFGGGIDLTPHYVVKEDAQYFHKALKNVCDKHHSSYYSQFKNWADEYFFIKHRKETRGIGGIFFDRLSGTNDITIEERYNFVQDIGKAFVPIYTHLMNKNKALSYGVAEKKWQNIRRGRYVEFNLVLDKGTKFGLDTDGRTESILMSMPPLAEWEYEYQVEENSKEADTLGMLKQGIDWINE